MAINNHLPLKVVLPRGPADFRRSPGGGSTKMFCDLTSAVRAELAENVIAVERHFREAFDLTPDVPAVARVELRPAARAKSNRPTQLFQDAEVPVIGCDRPGEMLVGVDPAGLNRLRAEIRTTTNKKLLRNISAMSGLKPYTSADVLEGETPESLASTDEPLQLRLFRHASDAVNDSIDRAATEIAGQEKIPDVTLMDYGDGLRVLAIRGATPHAILRLATFVGTQSITHFPRYMLVRTASHSLGVADDRRFPAPIAGRPYGLVGIIDSGTDPNNKRLQAYVLVRDEEFIPRSDQNNEHGTFVAGLIAHPRALNGADQRFPDANSKIIDVVAIGKSDSISEYDLITVIDRAVRKYPQVRVWNLSLAQSKPCVDKRFSMLACKLDSISRRRKVLFVIAAGNCNFTPLRSWPPQDLGEGDRICPPADSIRSITVGSLAHIHNQGTCVESEQPSPFTRRGPAPHFYLKPEVSHYGGNCSSEADYLQSGVVSLGAQGMLAENIGTSFAAPIVSTVAANLFRELEPEGNVSPAFVKALLVHSAFIQSGMKDIEAVRYRGFGKPGDVMDILNCSSSSATVVFHADLTDTHWYVKKSFPIPRCLFVPRKGLRAEIFMTLAYDPPTDARFGIEYCRTNVTASLGTSVLNRETKKRKYTGRIPPAPKGITQGFEDALVQDGFKWSPLKLYRKKFDSGHNRSKWRFHMSLLNRAGVVQTEPLKAVAIITIRDPLGKAFVYDGLVREMDRLAWGATNLQIASRQRVDGRN